MDIIHQQVYGTVPPNPMSMTREFFENFDDDMPPDEDEYYE